MAWFSKTVYYYENDERLICTSLLLPLEEWVFWNYLNQNLLIYQVICSTERQWNTMLHSISIVCRILPLKTDPMLNANTHQIRSEAAPYDRSRSTATSLATLSSEVLHTFQDASEFSWNIIKMNYRSYKHRFLLFTSCWFWVN